MSVNILIVDDDKNICKLLELYLSQEGYKLYFSHDGSDALNQFEEKDFDLVILDLMLPVINGWEVCKMIKQKGDVPVMMLTARDILDDKLSGFEAGAEDYIVKPFEPKEVVARVKVWLKNRGILNEGRKQEGVLSLGNLELDRQQYAVKVNGTPIEMKPKEIELLQFLILNKGNVFTRDQLLEKVWHYDYPGNTRTVDVHIQRLREKLNRICDAVELKTVWGVGYKLEEK